MTDPLRTPREVDAVDSIPPLPKLLAYGMQHVLVMSAGAVAPPLILGAAMHLPPETVAYLINCDLLVTGIAILIQSLGIGMFAGSMIGPRLARHIPANLLRWLVALLGIGLAVKLWIAPG